MSGLRFILWVLGFVAILGALTGLIHAFRAWFHDWLDL